MMQERNKGIDFLKGLLICLMVIGHSEPPSWIMRGIYLFHMPCFFMISGYLFSENHLNNPKRYLGRKIQSLWWPYVKWTLLFVILHNLFRHLNFHTSFYSTEEIMRHGVFSALMMWQEPLGGTFWFFKALLFASLVNFGWLKIFGTGIYSILGGILIFLIGNILLAGLKLSYYYITDLNLLAAAFMMCGILLRRYLYRIRNLKNAMILLLITIGVGTVYPFDKFIEMSNAYEIGTLMYWLISGSISVALILMVSYLPVEKIKVMSYMGRRSVDIMIFHFLSFKIVTWGIISYYDYSPTLMESFPVLSQDSKYVWILYSIVGIVGSLCIGRLFKSGEQMLGKTFNQGYKSLKMGIMGGIQRYIM